jgi:hypothetical protein
MALSRFMKMVNSLPDPAAVPVVAAGVEKVAQAVVVAVKPVPLVDDIIGVKAVELLGQVDMVDPVGRTLDPEASASTRRSKS